LYKERRNKIRNEAPLVRAGGIKESSLSPAYMEKVSIQPDKAASVKTEVRGTLTLAIP